MTIRKISEEVVAIGSDQSDVFVGGDLDSESSTDWKSRVEKFAVGQSVEITAKIESVKPWASYDDMLKSHVEEAASRGVELYGHVKAKAFAIRSGLDEKRATPFIAIEISDEKLN
ncbi:hypothetical protein LBMAG52_24130 [Planctomycetia bacterium]|nr:hypothetical protein LBMAG52_24130 [Planctomycetia bacterium]